MSAKPFHQMNVEEVAGALGTCDQGRELLGREGSLAALLRAFRSGRYSDEVMIDVMLQVWTSVRRRVVMIYDGYPPASDARNCPALTNDQWYLMSGSFAVDATTRDAALAWIHQRVDRIHERVAEGRRRLVVDELDEMIRFVDL